MVRFVTVLARALAASAVLAAAVFSAPGSPAAATAALLRPSIQPAPAATVLYASGGRLWIRAVDGGQPTAIRTPWPLAKSAAAFQDIQWSPDHRRVALDDGHSRLAVINLSTGHITILLQKRCAGDCFAFGYAWSPNGRYLAYVRPAPRDEHGTLFVWDSATGKARSLATGVFYFGFPTDWSHDSTRILVSTGSVNVIKNIFPSALVVSLQGSPHRLGRGVGAGWSPDDRFVGLVRSHTCGANTCDDAEAVQPSNGGPAITLTPHIASTFENPEWAQHLLSGGVVTYGFDRWVLGPRGHIARRLAGPNERIDSWSPDGVYHAVESYHPYQSTPDSLYIATIQNVRVHLYTAGRKNDCGACSKDVYSVAWGACGSGLVAFATPTYPTPRTKIVYPKLFLTHVNGGPLTSIPVPGKDASLVGFADRDQEVVAMSGGTLYRYSIADRSLSVIVRGVTALASPPVNDTPCS